MGSVVSIQRYGAKAAAQQAGMEALYEESERRGREWKAEKKSRRKGSNAPGLIP
jgi:hypothetical protein